MMIIKIELISLLKEWLALRDLATPKLKNIPRVSQSIKSQYKACSMREINLFHVLLILSDDFSSNISFSDEKKKEQFAEVIIASAIGAVEVLFQAITPQEKIKIDIAVLKSKIKTHHEYFFRIIALYFLNDFSTKEPIPSDLLNLLRIILLEESLSNSEEKPSLLENIIRSLEIKRIPLTWKLIQDKNQYSALQATIEYWDDSQTRKAKPNFESHFFETQSALERLTSFYDAKQISKEIKDKFHQFLLRNIATKYVWNLNLLIHKEYALGSIEGKTYIEYFLLLPEKMLFTWVNTLKLFCEAAPELIPLYFKKIFLPTTPENHDRQIAMLDVIYKLNQPIFSFHKPYGPNAWFKKDRLDYLTDEKRTQEELEAIKKCFAKISPFYHNSWPAFKIHIGNAKRIQIAFQMIQGVIRNGLLSDEIKDTIYCALIKYDDPPVLAETIQYVWMIPNLRNEEKMAIKLENLSVRQLIALNTKLKESVYYPEPDYGPGPSYSTGPTIDKRTFDTLLNECCAKDTAIIPMWKSSGRLSAKPSSDTCKDAVSMGFRF